MNYSLLFVLALWWRFPQHRQTALQFLLHDDFAGNRSDAANYLGSYYRGTQDPAMLTILAAIVLNTTEDFYVRRTAYGAMREIVNSNLREVWNITMTDGEEQFEKIVDWDFVRSHAG